MKCKVCGRKSDSRYCFRHKPRKALKIAEKIQKHQRIYNVTAGKLKQIIDEVFEDSFPINPVPLNPNAFKAFDKAMKLQVMQDVFLSIWKKRTHISEISGTYLGKEPLSIYFHHILPKEKYPKARLDEENVIILTGDEHINAESDIYKYKIINKRRKQLEIKYKL